MVQGLALNHIGQFESGAIYALALVGLSQDNACFQKKQVGTRIDTKLTVLFRTEDGESTEFWLMGPPFRTKAKKWPFQNSSEGAKRRRAENRKPKQLKWLHYPC